MFDTEGLVPVAGLYGLVGSPSWFTKCLIGKNEIYDVSCIPIKNVCIITQPLITPYLIVW